MVTSQIPIFFEISNLLKANLKSSTATPCPILVLA